jgi:hypothetical protein
MSIADYVILLYFFFYSERNRRVAKAYARAPVLTVNGSDDGFDGFRIGKNFCKTNPKALG